MICHFKGNVVFHWVSCIHKRKRGLEIRFPTKARENIVEVCIILSLLRLDMMKNFYSERVISIGMGCAGRWSHHPWEFSRNVAMALKDMVSGCGDGLMVGCDGL